MTVAARVYFKKTNEAGSPKQRHTLGVQMGLSMVDWATWGLGFRV